MKCPTYLLHKCWERLGNLAVCTQPLKCTILPSGRATGHAAAGSIFASMRVKRQHTALVALYVFLFTVGSQHLAQCLTHGWTQEIIESECMHLAQKFTGLLLIYRPSLCSVHSHMSMPLSIMPDGIAFCLSECDQQLCMYSTNLGTLSVATDPWGFLLFLYSSSPPHPNRHSTHSALLWVWKPINCLPNHLI